MIEPTNVGQRRNSHYGNNAVSPMRKVMETFYIVLTLSSLTTPNALFFSHPEPWENQSACVRALPKMEGAVARPIRYDATSVELFGTVIGGPLNAGSFGTSSECRSAEPHS